MKIIGVTQRKLCRDFYNRIEEISKYKLDYLILREKDLNDEELESMAIRIKSILLNSNIKLIINSNINVAIKVNAYAIHLSFKDFYGEFREGSSHGSRYGFHGVKGVSVHNIQEALEAEAHGADYLLYGHVFETSCKNGLAPRGIVGLKVICDTVKIPVYAIGGINEKNFQGVIKTGADGIAIMSSLMSGIKVDNFLGI